MKTLTPLAIVILVLSGLFQGQPQKTPELGTSSERANTDRTRAAIAQQVHHELAMLPYYGVFDWIEGQVTGTDTVVLRGQVTRPTTRSDAVNRVKKLESVARVVNQIETLPPSPSDDAIRLAAYRAIFNYNGPLFRYSTGVSPPIHIIVKNGRITLRGSVADKFDSQYAYTKARGVSGAFEVRNELRVEKGI